MPSFSEGLVVTTVAAILSTATFVAQLQQLPPPASQSNQTVSGTVVNSVTGEPIRRALVNLAGKYIMLTDAEGQFEFRNVPQMSASMDATKPGFFNECEISQGSFSASLNVRVSAENPPVVLKLIPEAVIFGRIESDGVPVEGLQVKLMAAHIVEGRRRWDPLGGDTTDDEGNFRIANLQSGTYYLVAGPNWNPQMMSGGYPAMYYPGVSDISTASPLQISPGQQLQADINAKPVPTFSVSGVISGIPPTSGVLMEFLSSSGEATRFPGRVNPGTGQFRARVPLGTYTMRVQGNSQDGNMFSGEIPLEVNRELQSVQLAVAPLSPIPVNIHASSPSPAVAGRPRRSSLSFDAVPPATVRLIPATASPQRSENYARLQRGGTELQWAISNLEPGKYFVDVSANGNRYVASVQCGNTDLLRDTLDVMAGSRLPAIEVEMRDDGASLSASIHSNGSSASGWVLVYSNDRPHNTASLRVEANGVGSLRNLAPGEYYVLALDRIDGLEYANPEVLGEFLGRATRVTLDPAQELKENLELIYTGK
jgi:hypothetical protein